MGIVQNMDWTGQLDWTGQMDWTDFYIFSIPDLHVTRHFRWHGTKEYLSQNRYTMSCLFCDFIDEHCLVCTRRSLVASQEYMTFCT
jgi:hypothetical protein